MEENINRKYKDRLFCLLFGSEEYKSNTLSLYNALRNTNYTDPDDIEITTMDDSVYMKMKNDVSFLISSHMEMYEHQSTYNPNMPIRGLIYMGGLYDKYIETKDLDIYSSTPLLLPTPKFVVFYNGDKNRPDKEITTLSSLFANPEESCIEMKVENYNINFGHNEQLLNQCKTLREYAQLVEKIKRNRRNKISVENAIGDAVDECIKEGILKDILLARKSEVISMCITEYNEARHIANEKNISRTEGVERMAKLIDLLDQDDRMLDIINCSRDKRLREQLFAEYGI